MMGGAVSKIVPVIPVDPITTAIQSKLPRGIRTIVNPAGPALKAAVGKENANIALDPLGLGGDDPEAAKQRKTLLGD